MSNAIAFVAVTAAAVGWYMAWIISKANLSLRAELARVKREKGLAVKLLYTVVVKNPKAKTPQIIHLEASNEGDAVAQLMQMKITLSHIVSLTPAVPTATVRPMGRS